MCGFTQKLFAVMITLFACLSASAGFAASTSTHWDDDLHRDDTEQHNATHEDTDNFQITDDNIADNPLEFLSIDDNATEVNDDSLSATLFDRDLNTWPQYLLSYDGGTDPEADFLIAVSKAFGIIFILGSILLLIRFLKLRRVRARLQK